MTLPRSATNRKVVARRGIHRPSEGHSGLVKEAQLDRLPRPPGKPGISALKLPRKQFLPSTSMPDFETKAACRQERHLRVKLLEETRHQGRWGDRARDLRHRLSYNEHRSVTTSLADPSYCRAIRQRVLGNLHRLTVETKPELLKFFTVLQKAWAVPSAELESVNLDRWKHAFRKNLDDRLEAADGWLFACFEASYDDEASCWQFHIHGLASEDYAKAVRDLRGARPYLPWDDEAGVPGCKKPIQLRTVQVADMPRPVGYALKSYWKLRGSNRRVRLPGDDHTRALLFLDEHRPEDFCFMMNLCVKNRVLVIGSGEGK